MTTQLTLYVSGDGAMSRKAAVDLRAWCDRHLGGRYRLDVLDADRWPERAAAHQVLVMPTLEVGRSGTRVAGQLSDLDLVMAALGLAP